ncbi:MAG TPA: tetratricopeptide repeat protein [Pyrinomonadaceae bacterium]|nr:tetratricopeptide repeat protein [Pyrinomonadaceae bacterium]
MNFVFVKDFFQTGSCAFLICAAFMSIVALSSSALCQDEDDHSGEAVALFNQGQDAHEKGEFSAAIEKYERALKLIPEFPEAELQRGNAYQSLGKLDEAETAFRKSVELRDDWSLALASLGSVLVRKNNFPEAEKYLLQAIQLDELNFPAYAAMTELRLKTKASPEILGALLVKIRSLTAKANPAVSIWASRAALENSVGDRKNAKSSAARALELDPKYQFALATSAEIALIENDPATADAFVKRLEAVAPASESAKGLRARVLVVQGRADDALVLLNSISKPGNEIVELRNQILAASTTDVTQLEKQLASDPKSGALLTKLCTAFRVGDPAKALDYCRRAAEAEPDKVQPVVGYAAALVQAKRYDEAVAVLRKLLTVAPDNATVHANLATALFQLKRYVEAKVEFRWLTDHQPTQAAPHYFLAIVHDQLAEFSDAAANYQEFLRLADPQSSKLEIEKVNLRLPVVQKFVKEGKGKKRG